MASERMRLLPSTGALFLSLLPVVVADWIWPSEPLHHVGEYQLFFNPIPVNCGSHEYD